MCEEEWHTISMIDIGRSSSLGVGGRMNSKNARKTIQVTMLLDKENQREQREGVLRKMLQETF